MKIVGKNSRFFLFFLSIFLCLAGNAFADISFSGYTGMKGDIYSNSNGNTEEFDPAFRLQAFFSGQINITQHFLTRAEFSIKTDDMVESGMFNSTPSEFCIDELSLTYIKPILGIVQYFNLFLGTYEPIGNDVFLQRQFGIQSMTSRITESWLGLKGSTAYPFYGAGGSYIVHMASLPVATGFYIYVNKENEEEERQLNIDWRIGSVNRFFSLDVAAGIGAPMGTKNGNNDVILLIDTVYMHAGADVLLGNKYTSSLFLQGGFSNLQLKAGETKHEIKSKDIYLLVEPRLVTKKFQAHLTLFSVPEDAVEDFIFVEDTLGANLCIFTDNLHVKNKNITFGFHVTWSITDKVTDTTVNQNKDFLDLKEAKTLMKDCDHHVKVSPFLAIPILSGTLHTMFQAKVTDIDNDTWQDAFKLSIGYKCRI